MLEEMNTQYALNANGGATARRRVLDHRVQLLNTTQTTVKYDLSAQEKLLNVFFAELLETTGIKALLFHGLTNSI